MLRIASDPHSFLLVASISLTSGAVMPMNESPVTESDGVLNAGIYVIKMERLIVNVLRNSSLSVPERLVKVLLNAA